MADEVSVRICTDPDEALRAGQTVGTLATELRELTERLNVPRSTVNLLLGELAIRGRLRLDPEPADQVQGPELLAAIEAAGLKVVRA
jgi:hypothetical protein